MDRIAEPMGAHRIRIPEWARVRSGGRTHVPALNAGRTALLIVDMQRGFIEREWPMAIPGAARLIPKINRLASAVRRAGGVVAAIRHSFSDAPEHRLTEWHARTAPRDAAGAYLLRPGAPAHALHPDLVVQANDWIVDKYRFSALHLDSSALRGQLDARGIDTVIVVGVATNVCCESTARDAQMCGYRVLMVADATATFTDLEHNAALINLGRVFADIRSAEDVVMLLHAADASQ